MSARMVLEVARWEFRRAFSWRDTLVALVVTVLLGLAYVGASALLERALDRRASVVVVNGGLLPFELPASSGVDLAAGDAADEARLRDAVGRGDVDGLLVLRSADEAELVVARRPVWEADLARALTLARRDAALAAAGLSPEQLAEILAPVRLDVQYHEAAGGPFDAATTVTAGVVLALMLMGVVLGSNQLFVGIAGEKQLRVTEQVVSAISPQTWIDGKILGHAAATIVSVATFGLGALASNAVMNRFGSGVTLPAFVADPRLVPLFALFAVLGFFMWFTLYAAIAATVDDPNTSSRSMLLFAPFLPLGLGFAALARDPDAWATRVLGMLPITSPAVMPLRACLARVPVWEVVVAAALLVASAWLLRRVAGRVFAVGILMYGKEPTWSEVRRWSKEVRRP